MAAEPGPDPAITSESAEPAQRDVAAAFWARVREHKIIQWGIAYLGAALALGQGQLFLADALDWPDVVGRALTLVLIAGLPIALTLAWYHGHRGLQSVSAGELTIISLLILIGALFFAAAIRPADERPEIVRAPGSDAAVSGAPLAADPPAPARPTSAVSPTSVAVLPFENLSSDAANALYANAMHAEVIGQLSKLKNLTVISRESVMQYAADRPPMHEIAASLRVHSLLTGRFQYVGGRTLIGLDLVDPASGANLWSERYERDLQEDFGQLFAVQADIAMNVANALRAQFSEEERARLERRPTESMVAYGLFLEAVALIGQGEQAPRIEALLNQAIAVDPSFARAYEIKATLYQTLLINTTVGSAREPQELERLIDEALDKALELDPESAAAFDVRASMSFYSWRWTEGLAALRKSQELVNTAPYEGTWIYAWAGLESEALRAGARETEINPRFWSSWFTYGLALTYAGDHAAAAAAFRDGITLAPTLAPAHAWLGLTEIVRGNPDEARRELQRAEDLLGANRNIISLIDIAYGWGRLGDAANARRLFDEISAGERLGQDIGAGGSAVLNLAVGNYDEALAWLHRAGDKAERHEIDVGFYSLMNLKLNYVKDPVLEQPEFVAARARLRGD